MQNWLKPAFAAFVILFVAGFLVHGVWLGETYRQMRDAGFSFRAEEAMRHKLWIILVSDFLYSILFALVYAKGMEQKPWVGQGIRYGIFIELDIKTRFADFTSPYVHMLPSGNKEPF